MVNRNPVSQWFITFPRWQEYDDIKQFQGMSPESKWGYAVKESHEDGGIHYHLMLKLKKGMTKSKMLAYWTKMFPNDYKRIDIEPTKDFRAAHKYLQKEQLDVYEWGQGMQLPVWLQVIKDEWDSQKDDIERRNRRIEELKTKRLQETWLAEHNSVYCYACDKPLPCEDHDGLSQYVQF